MIRSLIIMLFAAGCSIESQDANDAFEDDFEDQARRGDEGPVKVDVRVIDVPGTRGKGMMGGQEGEPVYDPATNPVEPGADPPPSPTDPDGTDDDPDLDVDGDGIIDFEHEDDEKDTADPNDTGKEED